LRLVYCAVRVCKYDNISNRAPNGGVILLHSAGCIIAAVRRDPYCSFAVAAAAADCCSCCDDAAL